jgi:hypothetical protein
MSLGKRFPAFQRNVAPSSARLQSPKTMKKAKRSFRRSGTTYPAMQCHIAEDQNPQQNFKFMYKELSPLTYCHVAFQSLPK